MNLSNNFLESGKQSALFAQVSDEDITAEETKQFQIMVNKTLAFSVHQITSAFALIPMMKIQNVNGFNPRAEAPYFLINIAKRDELAKAHKTLRKTKYYDHLNAAYLKFLKIKPKKT